MTTAGAAGQPVRGLRPSPVSRCHLNCRWFRSAARSAWVIPLRRAVALAPPGRTSFHVQVPFPQLARPDGQSAQPGRTRPAW